MNELKQSVWKTEALLNKTGDIAFEICRDLWLAARCRFAALATGYMNFHTCNNESVWLR